MRLCRIQLGTTNLHSPALVKKIDGEAKTQLKPNPIGRSQPRHSWCRLMVRINLCWRSRSTAAERLSKSMGALVPRMTAASMDPVWRRSSSCLASSASIGCTEKSRLDRRNLAPGVHGCTGCSHASRTHMKSNCRLLHGVQATGCIQQMLSSCCSATGSS